MDDFGTGYSSMIYLQTLPLNELKIDHRFIRSTQPAATSQAIVTAVLDVAHALNLQVVAEGVGRDATLRDREALDFDVVQGYELCGPVTPAELVTWLENQPDQTMIPVG
jgi:EAL domain-containing protein (putative c-di-GMP-specific phosphodiesterase class I)